MTREAEIWLALRHRWADGTTHLGFDPLKLMERLAVLTPRRRVNLILHYSALSKGKGLTRDRETALC